MNGQIRTPRGFSTGSTVGLINFHVSSGTPNFPGNAAARRSNFGFYHFGYYLLALARPRKERSGGRREEISRRATDIS